MPPHAGRRSLAPKRPRSGRTIGNPANNTVGLTDDSQLGPLRANNTVESVHYLATPDDSKRRESGSIFGGNTWPLPVVLAGRSEILHSRHPELCFRIPQITVRCSDSIRDNRKRSELSRQTNGIRQTIHSGRNGAKHTVGSLLTIRFAHRPQRGQTHGPDSLLPEGS
jgi:hypothetical protein